jgi:hypothetical protein
MMLSCDVNGIAVLFVPFAVDAESATGADACVAIGGSSDILY